MGVKAWLAKVTDPDWLKELLGMLGDAISQEKIAAGARPDLLGDLRGGVIGTVVDAVGEAAMAELARREGVSVEEFKGKGNEAARWERPKRGALSRAVPESELDGAEETMPDKGGA